MEARNIPLRVLYTINSSPQYILARSPSPVPVLILLQDGPTGNQHLQQHQCYATALLKTCLDTICRSSPELVQDTARDFSVYVLDPLESNSAPAPVSISNNTLGSATPPSTSTESSNGVAVGLGLMSWAMAAGESGGMTVTGTLVQQGTGREALEVIFALRETAAMQKSNLAATLKSWGTAIPTSTSNVTPTAAVASSSCPPGLPISSGFQPGQVFGSVANLNPSKANLLHPPVPSTSAIVSVTSLPISLGIHSRKKPSKSKKCIKPAPNPFSEADKIMLSEETYIGPRRKKGRPAKASGATAGSVGQSISGPGPLPGLKHVIIIDDPVLGGKTTADLNSCSNQSDSSRSEATNRHLVEGSVSSACATTTSSLHSDPIPTSPQTSITLLDILAYLSASSSSRDQNVQNAALLAALNAIDSPTNVTGPDDTSNPVLVNALKDLISAVSKQTLSPRSRDAQNFCPQNNDHRRVVSQDDEIVLLDKENVNPTAFRRRGERGETDKKVVDEELPTFLGGVRVSSLGSQQTSPPPSFNFDGTIHNRKIATRLDVQSVSAAVRTSPSPVAKRKRTLSDFMEDRGSRMSSGQSRGKEAAERRHLSRHVHSSGRRASMNASASGLRHYPRVLDQLQRRDTTGSNSYYRTGIEVWSSPPRSRNEDYSTIGGGSDYNAEANTIDLSESSPSPRATASSPVRSQSRPRKRYIVPEWARTETSTQPRLSQAAQEALAEAGENEGGRKKSRHRGEREKKRRTRSAFSRSVSQTDVDFEESTESVVLPTCPQPVASSSDCPIFAVASAERGVPILFQSSADSRSPGPLLSKSNLEVPKTPPRRRSDHARTPGNDSGSLFTPASLRPNSRIFAESPFLSSHRLLSPLSSKKTSTSPSSRKLVIGDLISQLTSPTRKEADCSKDMDDDALHQELDDAFKQMDQSCSSTSDADGDQNEECSSIDDGRPYPHSEISGNITVNALWAGLPPSSPPPMSSPLLMPDTCSDDEDMDDLDLPVATSDVEDCTTDSEAMPPSSDMPDLSTCSDQEFAEYLSNNDLGALLAAVDRSTVVDPNAEFDMGVFNEFTTLNASSDGSYSDQNSDMTIDAEHMGLQNGFAEFDFTEFWETFKPLVQDHMLGSNTEPHPGFVQDGDIQTPEVVGNLDHTRLAEDVQALLSGCIV